MDACVSGNPLGPALPAARAPQLRRHAPLSHPALAQRRAPCVRVAALPAQQAAAAAAAVLPPELRKSTATLTAQGPDGPVTVHVLGVSHVSKDSVRHVERLIELARPDAVLVELCAERVGLLLGGPPPRLWHARRVVLSGLPASPGWPAAEALAGRLKSSGGRAVGVADIEEDVQTLLSSGLFGRVVPVTRPGPDTLAPSYIQQGASLSLAAPLGEIEFAAVPRVLPGLKGLAVEADAGLEAAAREAVQAAADAATAAATSAAAAGAPTLDCLLALRQALLSSLPAGNRAEVSFSLDDPLPGSVRAAVRRVPAGRERSATGLEVPGGRGPGIQPFQRQAQPAAGAASLGSSTIDLAGMPGLETAPTPAQQQQQQQATVPASVDWRPWTEAERQADDDASSAAARRAAPGGAEGAFATALTRAYAKLQAQAGRTVGLAPGAAWRAAVAAAAKHGARQVLLGDRPADVTALRLGRAIWASSAPFLLGSIPAALASAGLVWEGLGRGAGGPAPVLAAAALPLAAAAWPVAAPLLEVWRFSRLSAAEIEEAVRIKEALQTDDPAAPPVKLWGEDALLGWPGAMGPVIHERDAYMARALAAAALGRPEGLTPALVPTGSGGGALWRYCMPEGSSAAVCPKGRGDGAYSAPRPRTLVAVVGTAHVRGIARRWADAQRDVRLDPFV